MIKFIPLLILFYSYALKGQHSYLAILEDQTLRFDTTYWVNHANLLAFDSLHAWRNWSVAQNFEFGKDRGNLPMITDLNALHPYFREKIELLIARCKSKGIDLAVVESFRTRAKQAEYFGMGKKYTRSKGGKSKHQYGLACDVVPIVNGQAQWDDLKLWRKVGVEGERLGLRWGGRWRSLFDPAHFEWTGGLTTAELTAGMLPNLSAVSENLQRLRRYWNAWEEHQDAVINIMSPSLVNFQPLPTGFTSK